MSGDAHIIDIGSIVLTGIDRRNPDRLSALIESEVRRVLGGSDWSASTVVANNGASVARQVSGSLLRFLQGGPDGV